jgi:DNA polymerase-1
VSLAVAPGASGLPAARPPLSRRTRTQLPRDEVLARLKPWLESDARQDRPAPQVRPACTGQPRHSSGRRAHDTLLQSYVLESGKDGVRGHDLGQLATRHLGLATIPYEALCGKGTNQIGFDQVAIDQAAEYAAEDADLCLRLHARLYPQIAADAGLLRVYETSKYRCATSSFAWNGPAC